MWERRERGLKVVCLREKEVILKDEMRKGISV